MARPWWQGSSSCQTTGRRGSDQAVGRACRCGKWQRVHNSPRYIKCTCRGSTGRACFSRFTWCEPYSCHSSVSSKRSAGSMATVHSLLPCMGRVIVPVAQFKTCTIITEVAMVSCHVGRSALHGCYSKCDVGCSLHAQQTPSASLTAGLPRLPSNSQSAS